MAVSAEPPRQVRVGQGALARFQRRNHELLGHWLGVFGVEEPGESAQRGPKPSGRHPHQGHRPGDFFAHVRVLRPQLGDLRAQRGHQDVSGPRRAVCVAPTVGSVGALRCRHACQLGAGEVGRHRELGVW